MYDRGAWFLTVIMLSSRTLLFAVSEVQFFSFNRSMYNKTIIRYGFGKGKGYQPQPSASTDNPYLDLDYSGYPKNLIQ